MNVSDFVNKSKKSIKSNSPEILIALGISGVITTAYLAGKAAFEASRLIQNEQFTRDRTIAPKEVEFREKVEITWKLYIPAVACGTLTIGCLVASTRGFNRRTTAAVTAYSLTERAFSEYREKIVEQIGENKEQKVRDTIVQERLEKDGSKEVVIMGSGQVLCCELYTHRYFRSDMETLRKAQNDINARIFGESYISLSEFYDLIDISNTTTSEYLGWTSDKLMELQFTTILSESGEPCLAFNYNYVEPLR